MKSDIIMIDSLGKGFAEAIQETQKSAEIRGLNRRETVQLKMIAEEMLSLVRSVTGERQASFWIESTEKAFQLNLTTKTELDKDKRANLISTATSRKNEITRSFLGRLRDAFEEALTAEADHTFYEMPDDVSNDLINRVVEDTEWDGYERSVLKGLADNITIAIRGGMVSMTVSKQFPEA